MRKFFNNAIKNPVSISVLALFVTLLIWWIWSYFFIPNFSTLSFALNLWSNVYQLLALYGAILGLFTSRRWGGNKSYIGRAIIAFSIGLFLQCFGQTFYTYYVDYLNIQIPYPSIGDIGYFSSVLFYVYGALMLAKISKEKISLKLIVSKVSVIFIPLTILVLSYFILLRVYSFDWSNLVKVFLDFGYPLTESIAIFFVLLAFYLSRQKLGGAINKPVIFIFFAMIFQYLSDFVFIYQANNGTWYEGGINDLMYAVSYILMAFSLILLSIWPSILPD
ncbi:MAG: hypothetical protein WCV73_00710 [Patescibacteria group bacterium]|jgi:hypothetical protein